MNRASLDAADGQGLALAGRPNSWRMSRRAIVGLGRLVRRKPLGTLALVLIVLLLVVAIAAPQIAPYSYADRTGKSLQGINDAHLMGTDKLGRDELSRVAYAARATVKVGLGAAALAAAAALVLGAVSGFLGGWTDIVVQRVVDTMMSLPWLIVVLAVMAFVGSGTVTIIAVLALLMAPGISRVIRGATLVVRGTAYIDAARASGASPLRLLARHVLPNIAAPTIVVTTLAVGNAVLAEASLSFLGFGITPPTPSWGEMLSGSGRQFMEVAPWLAIFPGLAISITVFSFNVLGDALRDLLDPQLRGR